jgi:minichromosome maintenance protein 10
MNRLVSADSMSTRFSDIRFIRFQAIRIAMMGDNITGCWATVGVLTEKGNPKLSSTGKNFALWKLGSLDEITISLFLFGDEYNRHWKELPGSILSIINARIRREDKGNEFSLSVFDLTKL